MSKNLSSTTLSVTAAAAMLTDHAAVSFFKDSALYFPMRAVGRLSFPIFLFLIAQGIQHTSSKPRYLARLAVFAALSELPFDMLFYRTAFYPQHQNTIFTLLICAAALMLLKRYEGSPQLAMMCLAACSVLAQMLRVDGGSMAVLLAVFLSCNSALEKAAALLVYSLLNNFLAGYDIVTGMYIWNMAALFFILRYNGKRGGESCPQMIRKWGFYLLYPLHLTIFATIVYFRG